MAPLTASAETLSLDSESPTSVDEADLLTPGLNVQVSRTDIGLANDDDELNALSHGMDAAHGLHILYFSVDRDAEGEELDGEPSDELQELDGYDYNVFRQADLNQQAGDIYMTIDAAGVASYPQGNNAIQQHQNLLGMAPNILWFDDNEDEQDNLDALSFQESDLTGDRLPDINTYVSLEQNSTTLTANSWSAADILVHVPGGGLSVFASAQDMGLFADQDDIDALVLLDVNADGVLGAGDRALFSLTPGSKTLDDNGYSAGDIFATDFDNGHFVLYEAEDLGLLETDNVDALEVQLVPEPGTLVLLAAGGAFLASRRRRKRTQQ